MKNINAEIAEQVAKMINGVDWREVSILQIEHMVMVNLLNMGNSRHFLSAIRFPTKGVSKAQGYYERGVRYMNHEKATP